MKTIHDILIEIASKEESLNKLVDMHYNYKIKNEIFDVKEENKEKLTIKQFEIICKNNIKKFINKLIEEEVKIPDKIKERGIIFSFKYLDFDKDEFDIYSELTKIEDIKNNEENLFEATTYAFEFTLNSEILGYYVSDDRFTQTHLYEIISDVLYEASFFGYEEDNKIEKLNELNEMSKEIEEGTFQSVPFDSDKFMEEFGIDDDGTYNDKERDNLRSEIYKKVIEYNKYSKTKVLKEILENLIKENLI